MEKFFTGYCRVLDAARMVLADSDDGEADCQFPGCTYAPECPVAAQLADFLGTATFVREKATRSAGRENLEKIFVKTVKID